MSLAERTVRSWSLQKRLAWQLLLGIGLVLGGLFLVLDVMIDRAMYQRLDQFLSARAEAFAEQIHAHGEEELRELLPAHDLAGHTEFFALYDAAGRLRLASLNSGTQAVPLPPEATSPYFHDTRLPDGHHGRAVAQRLRHGGWLVLATERESWDHTERTMHMVLASGILLAILIAIGLCLWVLRQAFSGMRAEGERLAALQPGAAMPPDSHLPRELEPYARAVRDGLQRLMDALARERRFSRNIAHELRTPVAEVRASAEHALHAGDPAALRTGLHNTLAANARMERGIQALLALARYESGQLAPAPDPLDLVALISQQVRSLAQAEGFDAADRFDLALPDSLWIHSDVGMLERILTNLLHNAHEYSDVGMPVSIAIHPHEVGDWLVIRNAASTVSAEDVARFGERYWRGRGEDADAAHAGLGVALAVAMADALGLRLEYRLHGADIEARLGPLIGL